MSEDERQQLLAEQELLQRVMEAVDRPGPPDPAALAAALRQDPTPPDAPARAGAMAPRPRTPRPSLVPRQGCAH